MIMSGMGCNKMSGWISDQSCGATIFNASTSPMRTAEWTSCGVSEENVLAIVTQHFRPFVRHTNLSSVIVSWRFEQTIV